jgi:hypothetical protein
VSGAILLPPTQTAASVTSVNGQTGAVVLDAADVGADDAGAAAAALTAAETYADTKLAKAANLSDLANAAVARTNLGLGSAAIDQASQFRQVFSPLSYGAAGDGVTDDTTPVLAAFAAAVAAGGEVDITGYKFLTSSPIPLASYVSITGGTIGASTASPGSLFNTTGDLFSVTGTVQGVVFQGGYYKASAGHLFNADTASTAQWTWNNCSLVQAGNFKLWHMTNGIYLDMYVGEGCFLSAPATATASPWTAIGAGAVNSNRWHNFRCAFANNANVPFFHIESPGGTGYAGGNSFRDITAEQCPAGIITALSVSHLGIENVVGYDTTYTGDVFNIGNGGSGGLNPRIVSIRCSGWTGASGLATGVHDVNAPTCGSLVLENVGPQSSGFTPIYNVAAGTTVVGYPDNRTPADGGLVAWTRDPNLMQSAILATKGALWCTKFRVGSGGSVSKITVGITTAGASLSNCFIGIYNQAGTLIASTADISASIAGTNNNFQVSLSAPVVLTPGTYYMALLIGNGSTTAPTFVCGFANNAVFGNMGMTLANASSFLFGTGQTALPSTITPSSGTGTFAGQTATFGN